MPSFWRVPSRSWGQHPAWHRILRVSRTIADLAGHATIERAHLIEALGYRAMDRLLSRLRGGQ
jgi:magnesium chelatase family protein